MWSGEEEADYLNEKRNRCTVDHYITNSCRSLRVCVCVSALVRARVRASLAMRRQLTVAGSMCNYGVGSWRAPGSSTPSDVCALDETHTTTVCTALARHSTWGTSSPTVMRKKKPLSFCRVHVRSRTSIISCIPAGVLIGLSGTPPPLSKATLSRGLEKSRVEQKVMLFYGKDLLVDINLACHVCLCACLHVRASLLPAPVTLLSISATPCGNFYFYILFFAV